MEILKGIKTNLYSVSSTFVQTMRWQFCVAQKNFPFLIFFFHSFEFIVFAFAFLVPTEGKRLEQKCLLTFGRWNE